MKHIHSNEENNSSSQKLPDSKKTSAKLYTLYQKTPAKNSPKTSSKTSLRISFKWRWKNLKFWKDLAAPLTLLLILLGQGLNWELAHESQNFNRALADLKDKRAFRDKVVAGIMQMREVNAKHILLCKLGSPASLKEQLIERDHARFQAIAAFSASQEGFNKEAKQAFDELIFFDENVQNVCDPEAPTDRSWRKRIIKLFKNTLKNPYLDSGQAEWRSLLKP